MVNNYARKQKNSNNNIKIFKDNRYRLKNWNKSKIMIK